MVLANTCGQTVHHMRAIGLSIKFKATGSISGQMVGAIQANGNKTRWTARVATFGQMVAGTKGPTR